MTKKTAAAAPEEPDKRSRNRYLPHHCGWVQPPNAFRGSLCGYVIPTTATTGGGDWKTCTGSLVKHSSDPGGFDFCPGTLESYRERGAALTKAPRCSSVFVRFALFFVDIGGGWGAWLDVLIASVIGAAIGGYVHSRGWL